jgi:hypothetical protein
MAIFNLNGDEWNEETEDEGFAFSRVALLTAERRDNGSALLRAP